MAQGRDIHAVVVTDVYGTATITSGGSGGSFASTARTNSNAATAGWAKANETDADWWIKATWSYFENISAADFRLLDGAATFAFTQGSNTSFELPLFLVPSKHYLGNASLGSDHNLLSQGGGVYEFGEPIFAPAQTRVDHTVNVDAAQNLSASATCRGTLQVLHMGDVILGTSGLAG